MHPRITFPIDFCMRDITPTRPDTANAWRQSKRSATQLRFLFASGSPKWGRGEQKTGGPELSPSHGPRGDSKLKAKKTMLRKFIVCLTFSLTGCGSIYNSPAVTAGVDGNTNVRVVPITGESIIQANSSEYTPRALPAIFGRTAGAGSVPRETQLLPSGTMPEEMWPEEIETRLPPSVDPGPYLIGTGDVVLLTTSGSRNTSTENSAPQAAQGSRQSYTVRDDGSIAVPNVGRVNIAGKTVDQAEAELFQHLVQSQFDPALGLEVTEFNAHRISIGGAVAKATLVPVTLTPVFLNEALAAAGGISVTDPDFASIRLLRDGTLYQIPLTELYSNPKLMRTRLLQGDSVFVDTEYDLDRAQMYFEQQIMLDEARRETREVALKELYTEISLRRANLGEARSNFIARSDFGAEFRDYVYLTGEVKTQMRFALPFEQPASLADALYGAGDGVLVRTGDISEIYVMRGSRDPRNSGAVTAWRLDARNAANLTLATRFELRPDDIIFVAEQPVTRWNRVIQQITPSLLTTSLVAAAN